MEKVVAPRQDPENGVISNLLPKVEADAIDNYFGVLKNSAVIDGTNVQGFGTVNGHTYKWKMVIESLVKSIAVVPDRFFDITGRSYKIDQNRKISVNSLPDYENYKDAIIYKINNGVGYTIPDISKLIYDEGDKESKEIVYDQVTFSAAEEEVPLQTLSQLINKDSRYKLYEDNLLVSIIDLPNGDFEIDDIYIPQVYLDEPILEEDKINKYAIYKNGEAINYVTDTAIAMRDIIKEIDCTPPSGIDAANYDPVIDSDIDLSEIGVGNYVIFIPQDIETENNFMSIIDSSHLYKLYKVIEEEFSPETQSNDSQNEEQEQNSNEEQSETINDTQLVLHELTAEDFYHGNESEEVYPEKWDLDNNIIFSEIAEYNKIKYNTSTTNLLEVQFLINDSVVTYSKTIEVYKVEKNSELYYKIKTMGIKTQLSTFETSLNEYLWNHRVDMMNNDAGTEIISYSHKEEAIQNADYLAIIVDNNNNYIPLIGVIANGASPKGYTASQLHEEDEPLPSRVGNQLIWYDPCPKIDVSQFKGLDMWLKFEHLNELVYYLLTKYESNIISIDAATIEAPVKRSVNQGKSIVELQEGQEAERVRGKLWCYINPRTMMPFPDDYWFHQGEIYYIKSLTLATENKKINGKQITVKSGQWPGMYMLMGESWIRSRDTGEDIRLQIKIPRCKVKSDHTLTLSADGDPTVFNMNLEVAEPASGDLMEITTYEIKTRMIEDSDGKMYAVDGSSEVVIE